MLLSTESPESSRSVRPEPARILVDANIFARRQWIDPLIDAALARHVLLFWSPAIITEATRVLVWIRLSNHDSPLTNAAKRDAFDFVRLWFRRMTAVFHVVEDRPPYAAQWTETPRDEDDLPIWTAAVNAGADMVVTLNLKDGPPVNDEGLRVWNSTLYLHPENCAVVLKWWGDVFETGQQPILVRAVAPDAGLGDATGTQELSPDVLAFIRVIERRAAAELPPSNE
jgi:hypothetical protein